MSVISAAIVTSVADYLAKVGIKLYLGWHKGASHERAERYRAQLKRIDDLKQYKAEQEARKK